MTKFSQITFCEGKEFIMKRNMLRRLLIVVVALVLVFAFSTTAFASNTLYWDEFRLIKKGDNSYQTSLAQRILYEIPRYFTSLSDIDGNFGSGTKATVMSYQSNHNLTSDGIIGDNTWLTLEEELDYYQTIHMGTGYDRIRFKVDGVYCVNVVRTDFGDGSDIMYEWVVRNGDGVWRNVCTVYMPAGTSLHWD